MRSLRLNWKMNTRSENSFSASVFSGFFLLEGSQVVVVYCRPPVEGLAARMTLLQLSLSSADLAASLIRSPVQSLMSFFHRLLGRPLPLLPGTQPCMMSFTKQFAFLIICP